MAAASLREFIIDTLKEFYSRLSKKVGNVYITSYIGPLGEQPFNSINDVYDWIRWCKNNSTVLYADNGKTHFAKCNDGNQYLLTSNVAEYESLVDPNRKVKVKQPPFKGKVIVKRAIPITAAPGSVYLIHPYTERLWIPIKIRSNNSTAEEINVVGATDLVDSNYIKDDYRCYISMNTGTVHYDSASQTIIRTNGEGNGIFPICLPNLVDNRWYLIKILKPLLNDNEDELNFDNEHIEIVEAVTETTETYDTTCKLKFYEGKLHYDEQSLFYGDGFAKFIATGDTHGVVFNGVTFAEASSFEWYNVCNVCEIHTLKRTARASKMIVNGESGTNSTYYNHCIFAATIVGDNVIIYRRSERNGSGTAIEFTGRIETMINGYRSVFTSLTNDTRKIIEIPLSSYGLSDEEKLHIKVVSIRITANSNPDYFKDISEFKPNGVKISRGYKKLGSKKAPEGATDYYDFTHKKSGKYLYYKKCRGVRSAYPAILHVVKNKIIFRT